MLLLHGIIQSAELFELDAEAGIIEMLLRVQGVGPTHPRKLVVPYELLLQDDKLDPDVLKGIGFEAEVEQAQDQRWVVRRITLAGKMLQANDS